MNETAQAEQTPAPEAPAAKPTLEDLYDQYDVGVQEQPAAPPAAEPTAEPAPATDDVAAIQRDLASLRAEREAEKRAAQQREEEADLNKAVAILGKEAELNGKDDILRGFLIAKATQDARLRALWDARNVKPKAWKQALAILADEVRDEFAVPNPQLEENQRAMEESQRSQGTQPPRQPTPEDKALALNDRDFGAFWSRLAGRSY